MKNEGNSGANTSGFVLENVTDTLLVVHHLSGCSNSGFLVTLRLRELRVVHVRVQIYMMDGSIGNKGSCNRTCSRRRRVGRRHLCQLVIDESVVTFGRTLRTNRNFRRFGRESLRKEFLHQPGTECFHEDCESSEAKDELESHKNLSKNDLSKQDK